MKNIQKILIDYRSLFLPILLLVFFVPSWQFLLPKLNQAKDLYAANQQNRQKITKLQAKVDDLKSLNEYELDEKSKVLLSAIPSKKNVVGAMGLIEKIAEENEVVVGSIAVSPGEIATQSGKKSDLEELEFELAIEGEIQKFIDFWKTTSETFPLMNLGTVKIRLVGNRQAEIDCVLKSYYASLPVSIGRIDAPVPKLSTKEESLFKQIQNFRVYETETFEPSPGGKTNPFAF